MVMDERYHQVTPALVLSDMDDTFLAHDKHIPAENLQALDRLAELGVGFVPCTGRAHVGIPQAVTRHVSCRYVIASNGARIWDNREEKTLREVCLTDESVVSIYERVRELDISFDVFMGGKVYAERARFERMIATYGLDSGTNAMLRSVRTPVDENLRAIMATHRGHKVEKVTAYWADTATRDELARRLAEFPQIDVTSSHPRNVEFMAAGVSKGNAMMWLAMRLEMPASSIIAFGDSPNDVSMLSRAGDGVAVSNARPEVIACADHVCGTCDDAGPGRYLLNLL